MTSEDDYYYPDTLGSVGSVSTLSDPPSHPLPRREFAPGFHGANPGPSHEDKTPRKFIRRV